MAKISYKNYGTGHPWYYRLGGSVPTLKSIRNSVFTDGYEGYLAEDIKALARKTEPQRSRAIDAMRDKLINDLRCDISIYPRCARALKQYRLNNPEPIGTSCAKIHTSISLKHNHIYNGFANLKTLDELPEQQLDLFKSS